MDKALWNSEGQLGLKQPNKPFPLQQEVGVVKWRMQTTDESLMPLSGEMRRERGEGGGGRGEEGGGRGEGGGGRGEGGGGRREGGGGEEGGMRGGVDKGRK